MSCRHGENADLHPFSETECRLVENDFQPDCNKTWRERAEFAEAHLMVATQDIRCFRIDLYHFMRDANRYFPDWEKP